MLKSFAAGFAGLFLFASVCGAASPCDLNGDGAVNPLDVQLAAAMASGLLPCSAAVAGVGVCNATVVQRVTLASSNDDGLSSGQTYYYATAAVDQNNNESAYSNIAQASVLHSVVLSWAPSISANVVGYHIYRGATPAGPYARLTASPVAAAGYTDYRPAPGQMYHYAATAVDVYGNESEYSLTAQAVLPLQ